MSIDDEKGPCEHGAFEVVGRVARLTDGDDGPVTGFQVEFTVRCASCGVPFVFRGQQGSSTDEPRTSLDRTLLRAPIAPAADPTLGAGGLGFDITERRRSLIERIAETAPIIVNLTTPEAEAMAAAEPLWWLSFADGNRPEGEQSREPVQGPEPVEKLELGRGEGEGPEQHRVALEELCGQIGRSFGTIMPEGVGFALLMFDFGEEGSFAYTSNAKRGDMMAMLSEAIVKLGGPPDRDRDRLVEARVAQAREDGAHVERKRQARRMERAEERGRKVERGNIAAYLRYSAEQDDSPGAEAALMAYAQRVGSGDYQHAPAPSDEPSEPCKHAHVAVDVATHEVVCSECGHRSRLDPMVSAGDYAKALASMAAGRRLSPVARGRHNKLGLERPEATEGDGREELEELDKSPSEVALDRIAALCGCPSWDYPGQVVRDVEALAKRVMSATSSPLVEGVFQRIEERAAAPTCSACKGEGCPSCRGFGVELAPEVLERHLAAGDRGAARAQDERGGRPVGLLSVEGAQAAAGRAEGAEALLHPACTQPPNAPWRTWAVGLIHHDERAAAGYLDNTTDDELRHLVGSEIERRKRAVSELLEHLPPDAVTIGLEGGTPEAGDEGVFKLDDEQRRAWHEQYREPETVRDLLGLVMHPAPTLEGLLARTQDERNEAAVWAALEHLSAADNEVEREPKPTWLDELPREAFRPRARTRSQSWPPSPRGASTGLPPESTHPLEELISLRLRVDEHCPYCHQPIAECKTGGRQRRGHNG